LASPELTELLLLLLLQLLVELLGLLINQLVLSTELSWISGEWHC
jgi:hypothetical protein